MDYGPLVKEEIDAGAELVRAFDSYKPVTAAFWLKASDDPFRYLYLASEQVAATDITLAYREVLRLADQIQSPYFDPFRVKIIHADHPLARAAVEINHRFPGRLATRIGGSLFGGVSVDDVYLYPSPLPVSAV